MDESIISPSLTDPHTQKRGRGRPRHAPEKYHQLATEHGIEWLGPMPKTALDKTFWLCDKGHRWETTYAVIHQSEMTGCPYCRDVAMQEARRYSPEKYYELAHTRGFEWLGPEVINANTKTKWRCSNGHEWEAVYANIQSGSGCHECGKRTRISKTKLQESDYHQLALENGIQWLGEKAPQRNNIKTTWVCQVGHEWRSTYATIKSAGGCPHCQRDAQRNKPEAYHKLAEKRGFEWLGPEVENGRTSTKWRCPEGHVWWARYGNIHSGRGCPACDDRENGVKVSQLQRDLFVMLAHLPDAELNTRYGRFCLDITFQLEGGVNICVEYDSWHWHKDKLKQDARRDRQLIRNGWRVLRVKSNSKLPTQGQLEKAITELANGKSYAEITLDDWGDTAV